MLPTLVLSLALTPGNDPAGPKFFPPAYVRPEAPFGFLYQPTRDTDAVAAYPARYYQPQAGDVLLLSNTGPVWSLGYALAGTWKPGHAGVVARMPDGRLGMFEAGYNETLWTRFVPLDYRLNAYPGYVWVRRRVAPLTPMQDAYLTWFAENESDKRYGIVSFASQITPFRTRGPVRTFFVGKPRGPGHTYSCSEAMLEALVFAGLVNPETARPSATYPRDMFFDSSPNIYINMHPPLAGAWEAPSLWTPVVGWAAKGKERPLVGVETTVELPPSNRRGAPNYVPKR
jgi:hypothetical protein